MPHASAVAVVAWEAQSEGQEVSGDPVFGRGRGPAEEGVQAGEALLEALYYTRAGTAVGLHRTRDNAHARTRAVRTALHTTSIARAHK